MNIKKVHVVFKTHLDIGYTDYAKNVVRKYFNSYIPQAIETAYMANEGKDAPSFVWTTGSWLIHEYLKTQSADKVRKMEEAIDKGYIAWHALPFTTHSELMDTRLLRYGLSLAEELDLRYGRQTIAAKMTDVPGHTIGIVKPLAHRGVKYLHIGVNDASAVPDVPEMFVWRDCTGNELIVNYAKAYGSVHTVDGLDEALAFAFTGDNLGPCTAEQVEQSMKQFEAMFPGAQVCASTLDNFARAVMRIKDTLPVVTDEIGDSWIHGTGTDPMKVSQYRELLRLRDRWMQEGRMDEHSEEYRAFSGKLILVPEHTWGMDCKTHLPDFANYAKEDFRNARKRDIISLSDVPSEYSYTLPFAAHGLHGAPAHTYSALEASWKEQREYIQEAVDCLCPQKKAEAEAALQALQPKREDKLKDTLLTGETYLVNSFQVRFGSDGSIDSLMDRQGRPVTTKGLAAFTYQCYGVEDYDYWYEQYTRNMDTCYSWAIPDFGKLGSELVSPRPRQKLFHPRPESVRISLQDNTARVIANMPEEACARYGAPREIQTDYVFGEDTLAVEFRWFDKDANRLAEAMWLGFDLGGGACQLTLTKMDCPVSPYHVVSRGNRKLHVCQSVMCDDEEQRISFTSLDAPLVSTNGINILQFDNAIPGPGGSFSVNLYNNIYGTNFPMWYEEDGRFRFVISFGDSLGRDLRGM